MILISIESALVVFVFLQHAVILQKVMIDKKRELERLETNKVSIAGVVVPDKSHGSWLE